MTNNTKLSRREWFRLRIPHQNKMLDENCVDSKSPQASATLNPDQSPGLTPIEYPPNPDGLDLSELPPMREATLSAEQVRALISDIKQLATDIMLMQRATGAQRADVAKVDTSTKLDLAQTALLSGSIPRLQIRYRWQNQQWIDTLKSEPAGFHIVRIAHQVGIE